MPKEKSFTWEEYQERYCRKPKPDSYDIFVEESAEIFAKFILKVTEIINTHKTSRL